MGFRYGPISTFHDCVGAAAHLGLTTVINGGGALTEAAATTYENHRAVGCNYDPSTQQLHYNVGGNTSCHPSGTIAITSTSFLVHLSRISQPRSAPLRPATALSHAMKPCYDHVMTP